eukprot:6153462-Prymnesium_polylepis.1
MTREGGRQPHVCVASFDARALVHLPQVGVGCVPAARRAQWRHVNRALPQPYLQQLAEEGVAAVDIDGAAKRTALRHVRGRCVDVWYTGVDQRLAHSDRGACAKAKPHSARVALRPWRRRLEAARRRQFALAFIARRERSRRAESGRVVGARGQSSVLHVRVLHVRAQDRKELHSDAREVLLQPRCVRAVIRRRPRASWP